MVSMRMVMKGLVVLAAGLVAFAPAGRAQEKNWRHGVTRNDALKYPPDFKRLDYVNPDAPKGGTLRLSQEGTFDSFNPVPTKGNKVSGLGLVFDSLLKSPEDEDSTSYGLLAEAIAWPDDISEVSFRLRPEAKWADGQPVTVADVIYSFEKLKELDISRANYYAHVTGAAETGEREVTFSFDATGNRELPLILGQLVIVPRHWWEAAGADGKPRDVSRTTLEPVVGSGPYRIASFSAGSSIRYERREDYWAKDLPINVGQNNFGAVTYTYFGDNDVELEAFRAGNIDFRQESSASRWATAYDFPAVKDGRVIRLEAENPLRGKGIMQALVPNMRREKFRDARVRRALNFAFDFEDMNRNLAFNTFTRLDSYFWGTELASSGLPDGREKEILEDFRGRVPDAVFTTPYSNPVGGDPQKARENLRTALNLFKEAGYELKGNRLVNAAGVQFKLELLVSSASFERTVMPFINNLRKIGIDASLRTVDSSQYESREIDFDYDMVFVVWGQSMFPGNEQNDFWGSAAAGRKGSKNYAGIADPAIDELVRRVIFAPSRAELVPTVRALDRVLLAHDFVVPLFYKKDIRIAYSAQLGHPADFPHYGLGFPDAWWSKQAEK